MPANSPALLVARRRAVTSHVHGHRTRMLICMHIQGAFASAAPSVALIHRRRRRARPSRAPAAVALRRRRVWGGAGADFRRAACHIPSAPAPSASRRARRCSARFWLRGFPLGFPARPAAVASPPADHPGRSPAASPVRFCPLASPPRSSALADTLAGGGNARIAQSTHSDVQDCSGGKGAWHAERRPRPAARVAKRV